MTVDQATCEAVIAEAYQQIQPQRSRASSCVGMKVQEGHRAAAVLAELGWPYDDAQVVGYSVGGSYDLHTDGPGRELALMVQLSPPESYAGGNTLIHHPEWDAAVVSRELGSVHIWPGSLPHEVTEITHGERWALVAWQ